MREKRLWPVLQSVSEWSRSLGIDRKIIYAWVRDGLPVYQIGVKRKIFTEDIVAHMRTHLKRVEPKS
jgi:predicted site-specific integrase-resolvase